MIEPLTTVDWLNLVKAHIEARTDSQLADTLGIKRQTVSQQRARIHTMGMTQAIRTAHILQLPELAVIACAAIETYAKDRKARLEWRALWQREIPADFKPTPKAHEPQIDRSRAPRPR